MTDPPAPTTPTTAPPTTAPEYQVAAPGHPPVLYALASLAALVVVWMATFTLAQAAGAGELGARRVQARVLDTSVSPTGDGTDMTVLVDRTVHHLTTSLEPSPDGTVELLVADGTVRAADLGLVAAFATLCTLVAALVLAGCWAYRHRAPHAAAGTVSGTDGRNDG